MSVKNLTKDEDPRAMAFDDVYSDKYNGKDTKSQIVLGTYNDRRFAQPKKGWQGNAPRETADVHAPVYLSPHHNRRKSGSNPHVNQVVRFHHDTHSTGRGRAGMKTQKVHLDVFGGGGHQMLPPGPLTRKHTPSRKRQGYDKHAIRATTNLKGAGMIAAKEDDHSKLATTQNEQFRFYYEENTTSHVKHNSHQVKWSQERDQLWDVFRDTSSPGKTATLSTKSKLPDKSFGIATHRNVKTGKRRMYNSERRIYHSDQRLI